MNEVNYFLVLSIISLFFSALSTIIGLVAVIKVFAMEKSTHTMVQQMVPVDQEIEQANEEILSGWGRKGQTEIDTDQREFKEDLEADFPEFLDDIEDTDGAISF